MKKIYILLVLSFLVVSIRKCEGQSTIFGAGYFQNQYLYNPAMAGLEKRASLNLGYLRQNTGITGGGVDQYLAGQYGFANNMGVGLTMGNEEAGLIRATTVKGTVAYHLPLDEEGGQLSLGVSAGGIHLGINHSAVNGDGDDPLLSNFSERGVHFEMDLGLAYTSKNLSLQGAISNTRNYFAKDAGTGMYNSTALLAASYKINFSDNESPFSLEPKVVYRRIKGGDHVVDMGANCAFGEYPLAVYGMYHTTRNVTAGLSLTIRKFLQVSGAYTTQEPGWGSYAGNSFEIGLGFFFGEKNN